MPTPREGTPAEPAPRPNTHKLLHAVGKKLAATAASTSAPSSVTKRKRQESSPMSKHKRRKTLSSIPLPAAHPRELIRKGWSRSGRKHLPSVKAREIEPIQAQKRPRGRPRLHPIPTSSTQLLLPPLPPDPHLPLQPLHPLHLHWILVLRYPPHARQRAALSMTNPARTTDGLGRRRAPMAGFGDASGRHPRSIERVPSEPWNVRQHSENGTVRVLDIVRRQQ
ncbi:hypothetical protein BJV77DRAFT_426504 [Russula vinacea]|nr:hypothetical protein BJV77DRAFT_426504 [Russula vinacea]